MVIDRDTASRLGVAPQDIDNVLYDAFGQRFVSTIYQAINQYHVVMEVAPQFQQSPDTLKSVFVHSSNGSMVPLSAFTHFGPSNTSLAVAHQGVWPSVTMSFNLAPGGISRPSHAGDRDLRALHRFSRDDSCQLSGNRGGLSGVGRQRAGADPDGTGRGLHRSWNSLRELHPSHHDSLDHPFGRGRGFAGLARDPQRAQRDRSHRHHLADWHGEEKCHHDDRLRAGRRAQGRQVRLGSDLTKRACFVSGPS